MASKNFLVLLGDQFTPFIVMADDIILEDGPNPHYRIFRGVNPDRVSHGFIPVSATILSGDAVRKRIADKTFTQRHESGVLVSEEFESNEENLD